MLLCQHFPYPAKDGFVGLYNDPIKTLLQVLKTDLVRHVNCILQKYNATVLSQTLAQCMGSALHARSKLATSVRYK